MLLTRSVTDYKSYFYSDPIIKTAASAVAANKFNVKCMNSSHILLKCK